MTLFFFIIKIIPFETFKSLKCSNFLKIINKNTFFSLIAFIFNRQVRELYRSIFLWYIYDKFTDEACNEVEQFSAFNVIYQDHFQLETHVTAHEYTFHLTLCVALLYHLHICINDFNCYGSYFYTSAIHCWHLCDKFKRGHQDIYSVLIVDQNVDHCIQIESNSFRLNLIPLFILIFTRISDS